MKKLTLPEFRWLMKWAVHYSNKSVYSGKVRNCLLRRRRFPKQESKPKEFCICMSKQSGMKGSESSMEQTKAHLAIQQQQTMLQSIIGTLREKS